MKDDCQIRDFVKNNFGQKQNFKEGLCEFDSEIKQRI